MLTAHLHPFRPLALAILTSRGVLLLLALISTLALGSPNRDLQAIRNYKPAALENACVIESLAFTAWLQQSFPQHPSRVIYFPIQGGGHHAVALFTLAGDAYLWDMDFGPLDLGLKATSLELPSLARRASAVFHRALRLSAAPEVELALHGGKRMPKMSGKIQPPTGVSLAEWVYQRIRPVVPDATLVTYHDHEYVVFVRELAAHVFSAGRGTLVAIARSEGQTLPAIQWLLSDTFGGDGRYAVIAGEPRDGSFEMTEISGNKLSQAPVPLEAAPDQQRDGINYQSDQPASPERCCA